MALELCGAFTSWVGRGLNNLEDWVSKWDTKTSRRCKMKRGYSYRYYNPGRKKHIYNVAKFLCLMTQAAKGAAQVPDAVFDTDSTSIKVDNCATKSISNDTKDFIGKLTPSRRLKVKGLVGYVPGSVMMGTFSGGA